MSAAGTGELQFIEGTMNANMYCDILKQSMIPSLWTLDHRSVFHHDNDHCLASNHITLQPKTGCPLKLSRVESSMGDLVCCCKRC